MGVNRPGFGARWVVVFNDHEGGRLASALEETHTAAA
jgi:hypothetical protein